MKDHRIEQLEGLIKLLKDEKSLKKRGDQLDREHLEAGYYCWNTGDEIVTEYLDDLSQVLKIKSKHDQFVKLDRDQVDSLRDLAKTDPALYSKAVEISKEYSDKSDIKGVPVELKAVASAAAKFEVTWDKIRAEIGIKAGVSVTFGKEGGFQYSASLNAAAKAYAEVKRDRDGLGVSAAVGAEAVAEAEHRLQSKDIAIGDSDYAIAFYSTMKAFAKAEAKASAGANLNPLSKDAMFGATASAWAGFGVAVEIGVQLKGKYGSRVTKKRLLANTDGVFTVELGVGVKGGAAYTTEAITIGDYEYIKRNIAVDADLFAGASINLEFSILTEIEDDIREKMKKAIKKQVKKLIGDELYDYIKEKYGEYKARIEEEAKHTWNVVSKKVLRKLGKGDSYEAVHLELKNHIIKLEGHVKRLEKAEDSKERQKLEKRIAKIKKYFEDHQEMVEQTQKDFDEIIEEINNMDSSKESVKRVAKDLDKLEAIIKRIVSITRIKSEMAMSAETLKTEVTDEDVVILNKLLDEQERVAEQLDEAIEHIKDLIMEFQS